MQACTHWALPRDSAVDHMRKHLLVIVNVLATIFLFLSACLPNPISGG
jgi:hypothetical protein